MTAFSRPGSAVTSGFNAESSDSTRKFKHNHQDQVIATHWASAQNWRK
jgi:hypothetical protein